jgi:NADH-quinone oxidoreductase subunit J
MAPSTTIAEASSSVILYAACVVGAVGLYLLLVPAQAAPRRRALRTSGALLGVGALAYLLTGLAGAIGAEGRPEAFFLIFTAITLAAGVKMITTSRPVYSALYFVLVVLASAGLFLLLAAEFMAFALIIVYAGAILITYMFVLMLAQQSPDPEHPAGQAEYDVNPREPAAGAVVGFVLLALFARMAYDGAGELPAPPTAIEAQRAAWEDLERMPGRVREYAEAAVGAPVEVVMDGQRARVTPGEPGPGGHLPAFATVLVNGEARAVELPAEAMPENVERVGLALIAKFPVSLELAGVILLLAMFGAVILARRQIELTEDQKRAAAGLRRLGHHDEPGAADVAGGGAP